MLKLSNTKTLTSPHGIAEVEIKLDHYLDIVNLYYIFI